MSIIWPAIEPDYSRYVVHGTSTGLQHWLELPAGDAGPTGELMEVRFVALQELGSSR